MQKRTVAGIDVSNAALDYTWIPQGKASRAKNTAACIAYAVVTPAS